MLGQPQEDEIPMRPSRLFRSLKQLVCIGLLAGVFVILLGGFSMNSATESFKTLMAAVPAFDISGRLHDATCRPEENVFLLKTHRCEGAILENILLRHGLARNLSFALPISKYGASFDFPQFFKASTVLANERHAYNVMFHHARFDKAAILEVLPASSVFVGLVRDPVAVYREVLSYFTGLGISVPDYILKVKAKTSIRWAHSQNPLLFDFGIARGDELSDNSLRSVVRKRFEQFHLILNMDYIDESVVVLKEYLCLALEDVVYLTYRKRAAAAASTLSAADRELIRDWNHGDSVLYQLANDTFWSHVDTIGVDRVRQQVARLVEMRAKWQTDCLRQDGTQWILVDGSPPACRLMFMNSAEATQMLYTRQQDMFP